MLTRRLAQFEVHFASLASMPMLVQGFSRLENSTLSLTQSVASITNKISNIEQSVDGVAARVAALEAGAASVSSGCDSARYRNVLGHSDGSTAQDHLMTTETQDADLMLHQTPLMNMREVPSCYGSHVNSTTLQLRSGSILFGKGPTYLPTKNLSQFIARQVPCRPGLYSKQEPNLKTLLPDIKMMVSPMKLTVPFCCVKTTITVRQAKSLEDREIGKRFAPLWRVLADQLKIIFPDGDDEGAFIVPALDARSQVLSIKDRRNGVGKPVFKLALFGSGQLFTLITPDLCVPGISSEVLQRVISQASTANV